MYRLVFNLILRRLPAEFAHSLVARTSEALGKLPGVRPLLRALLGPSDASIRVNALGRTFPSPIGVAAGLDKYVRWFRELAALGFGFVEVGTVTARAQTGNPKPRVRRLPAEHALINSMGSPNDGAVVSAARLARRGEEIVAVNIGRSRAATDTNADYRESVRTLAPLADFIVLNVSSPNTPGLRDLQDVDILAELIAEVRTELASSAIGVPLLIKISPDATDRQIDELAELAVRLRIDGIVAVNTTTSRSALKDPAHAANYRGGLSGPPLKPRALEVLRRLRAITDDKVTLISVGGIETAEDAWNRILAGASLVQAHTGFVYGGPLWAYRLNRGLAARVRAHGGTSIGDFIGMDARQASSPDPLAKGATVIPHDGSAIAVGPPRPR